MNELSWYEVWADEGINPPYVLVLLADHGNSRFEIYDPTDKRIVFTASTYDGAKEWLLEDEYTRVDGRMVVD